MKHTLYKSILVIVILFTQCFTSIAQLNIAPPKIFLLNFSSSNISYDVLMVIYSTIDAYDARNYTRTAYYDLNKNYNIYNQNWTVNSGVINNQRYATITSTNGYFVTDIPNKIYNADSYTFIADKGSMVSGLPFKGNDVNNPSQYVNSYRQVNYNELTYGFLKRFFKDDESQFTYLSGLNNGSNQTTTTPPANQHHVLNLENNTNYDIETAYATYDGSCWVCIGWITVEHNNTKSLDVGSYSGQFFVHGESRIRHKIRNWGETDMLCVEEGEPFSIRCPRDIGCKVKKMFTLINSTTTGITNFIFNP